MDAPNNKAILCVDDEGIILMHLLMVLKRRYVPRCRIEGASDATAGLAAIERMYDEGCRVILILSDWLMPGIKGDEFIKTVHDRHPDIKAIMISGKTDPETMTAALAESGLIGFLQKPLVVDELYRLVDGIVKDHVDPA